MKNLKFLKIAICLTFLNQHVLFSCEEDVTRRVQFELDEFEETVKNYCDNLDWHTFDIMVSSLSMILKDSALTNDPMKLVNALLKFGIDIKTMGADKCENLLHRSIRRRKNNVAEFFINNRILDLHATTFDGRTPLHLAAIYDNSAICSALLEAGVDKNLKDHHGKKAEQCARFYGYNKLANSIRDWQ